MAAKNAAPAAEAPELGCDGNCLARLEKAGKFRFETSTGQVPVLNDLTFQIHRGEFTALLGASGSGKSTVLEVLSGLETLDSGKVFIAGQDTTHLTDGKATQMRRKHVGTVYQSGNLLPALTVRQNLLLPLSLASRRFEKARFDDVVAAFALDNLLERLPSELDKSARQRTAIARAVLSGVDLLLADEPTAELGSRAALEILSLLRMCIREFGQTVLLATHDASAAAYSDRVLLLVDGHVSGEISSPSLQSVLLGIEAMGSGLS